MNIGDQRRRAPNAEPRPSRITVSVRSVHVLSRKYIGGDMGAVPRYILARTCHYRIGRGIRRAAGGADGPHTGHHSRDAGKPRAGRCHAHTAASWAGRCLYSANAGDPVRSANNTGAGTPRS